MPRNRQKPRSQTFAGTGTSRPISIKGEKDLDEAVAKATQEREQRITVLEDENARLQVQLEQKAEEIEDAARQVDDAEKAREEAARLEKEAARKLEEAEAAAEQARRLKNAADKAKQELAEELGEVDSDSK